MSEDFLLGGGLAGIGKGGEVSLQMALDGLQPRLVVRFGLQGVLLDQFAEDDEVFAEFCWFGCCGSWRRGRWG